MPKISTRYTCQACGYQSAKWMGRCPDCGAFSTFSEENIVAPSKSSSRNSLTHAPSNLNSTKPQKLSQIEGERKERVSTQMPELDRVLGGGVVPGSLVLIGGDPGI